MSETFCCTRACSLSEFVNAMQLVMADLENDALDSVITRVEGMLALGESLNRAEHALIGGLLSQTLARAYVIRGRSQDADPTEVRTIEEFLSGLYKLRHKSHHSSSRHLSRFYELLNRECTNPQMTQAHIARHMGVSVWHLARLLGRHTGRSFRAHVRAMRCAQARGLLRSGRFSIKEVAAMAGFSSTSEFDRQFRKVAGMTPSMYRDLQL